MSEVLGDLSHLHRHVVEFSVVHICHGTEFHGSFNLANEPGFAKLASSRASVKIVSESLTCDLIGPASASIATTGAVAVAPEGSSNPQSVQQVLSIGGSVYCVHSLYQAPQPQVLKFAAETAHVIKPKPVFGEAPKVVYAIEVQGGTATSKVLVRVRGTIEVDGIGYVQPW